MNRLRTPAFVLCVTGLLATGVFVSSPGWGVPPALPQSAQSGGSTQSQATGAATPDEAVSARLARGTKLMLKDGTFQLVRSYERNGDRVRYYSLERGDWEEIPASMVDWDATKKAEVASDKASEALLTKVHQQEEAAKIDTVLDVDASLQVAPGVFLPPGEGMFVVEGKSVTPMMEVGSQIKLDKKQTLKQVLSPIPIVPSKRDVVLQGARATRRINTPVPEFYLREAPYDPDKDAYIPRSSRPGEGGPEVELVRAAVKGNKRQLESIKTFFGEHETQNLNTVPVQRWEVARTVYRFTLGAPLQPGEYALAEILPDGMNLYVWDFGVDADPGAKAGQH